MKYVIKKQKIDQMNNDCISREDFSIQTGLMVFLFLRTFFLFNLILDFTFFGVFVVRWDKKKLELVALTSFTWVSFSTMWCCFYSVEVFNWCTTYSYFVELQFNNKIPEAMFINLLYRKIKNVHLGLITFLFIWRNTATYYGSDMSGMFFFGF